MTKTEILAPDAVEKHILLVRGQKVILDADLARLYGVPTKRLNQQVRRNLKRFPADFMFELTAEEDQILRSQFAISTKGSGGRRYRSLVFTEQGVAMLSSVLNSERAIQVNIAIMRAFVQLRQILATHKALAKKLEAMEAKYDDQFRAVFEAIHELMRPPDPPRRRIGFRIEQE
ncbi:ORF6N domain-containing protein [bacterium]|nr:MAG: ORF6N domain-containing protein [bacterium]